MTHPAITFHYTVTDLLKRLKRNIKEQHMLPWILGGLIGAAVTAVVMYNEEEKEKMEEAKDEIEETEIILSKEQQGVEESVGYQTYYNTEAHE